MSIIDQRIAARLTQRQVECLARSARFEREVDRLFTGVKKDLAAAVASGDMLRYAEIMLSAMAELRPRLAEYLRVSVTWGHQSSANVYISELPERWLWSMVPIETQIAFEDIGRPGTLVGSPGMLQIVYEDVRRDPFGVPIPRLARTTLRPRQKQELFRQLVFPPPSAREVASIVGSTGWEQRFDSLSGIISSQRSLFAELVRGYSSGEGIGALQRRIEPLTAGVTSSAKRIARTEASRIAEHMQRRSADALGDMVDGMQIVAVLDARTRPEHATRNGQVYYRNPRSGQLSMSDLPDLPDAPNCRCMSTPVMSPPPGYEDDPAMRAAFAEAASGIVDPASYEDWFAAADDAERRVVVGVARYNEMVQRLGDARQPQWSDFVTPEGSLMTREQLRRETVTQRQARTTRVSAAITERRQAMADVQRQGFIAPEIEPALVPWITTSRKVRPSDPLSVLGEVIRQDVLKGDRTEDGVRAIGRMVLSATETPDVRRLREELRDAQKRLHRAARGGAEANQQMLLDALDQVDAASKGIREIQTRRIMEALAEVRDMGSPVPLEAAAGSDPAAVTAITEALRYYPRDWIGRMRSGGPIRMITLPHSGHGYWSPKTRTLAVSVTGRDARTVPIHELMHLAEHSVPGILEIEAAHYARRTKGNKLRPISWSPKAMTRRNTWMGDKAHGVGEYMGRDYGGHGWELFSMTAEGMMAGGVPVDTQVAELMLGAMASL